MLDLTGLLSLTFVTRPHRVIPSECLGVNISI